MNKPLILVVEDDTPVRNLITMTLKTHEYRYLSAQNGASAVMEALSHNPDIVLLDLGLPDMDGLEVLRSVRKWSSLPIVVVSARNHERDKVEALDYGADDYLVKPFGTSELLARIRTTLRRSDRLKLSQGSQKDVYHIKDLTVDIAKHQVLLDGEEIHFTQNEFKILELLCIHAGKVLTYDFILEHVWGPYGGTSNQILRVNIANIRRKLKENPSDPKYVLTELGIGYRMLED